MGGTLKAYYMPSGAFLAIYTLSGELVRKAPEVNGTALWDGKNTNGMPVSTGVYYYTVQLGEKVLLIGKLLVNTS